ncbi:PREDICTED: coiled-coil domain-containing protein 146 [Tinamus guttatus]|uniref:coiled-coil domain-containing protein 146 n=1 Tax=Tinamus guttatus TaxID=94827 RepID=UPI00052EF4D7|nr:PREDICTED: coiled-coil domain-containing protein 146 [Tinamus guttatus]
MSCEKLSSKKMQKLQLFSSGKLPGSRVAELKAKYALLHKTVISLQESEIQLLQEAKHLSVELEQQQRELEKAEQFPEESSSEASRMRQQLLKYQNECSAIKEREYIIQSKVECLQEEKRLLESEYERIPKHSEADKKIKQLKENCDELRKEAVQRKAEINAMKEDILSKQKLISKSKKAVGKLLEKESNLKDELIQITDIPVQLGKETEKMNRKKVDAEKKKEALNKEIQELNATLKTIEKRIEAVLQEKEDVMKELDGRRALLESKEREFLTLTKLLEISRENESAVLSDREALEDYLNKRALEKEKQHDILTHKQKLKDKEMRYLKKMELQLKISYESLYQIKSHHKRLKFEAETIPKKNEPLLERRRELQKEIEMKKRSLAEQKMVSNMEAHMLEAAIAEEDRLFKEQERCRDELSRLARLTWVKLEEREQKSKDVRKAQIRLQNVITEIKRKDLEISEHKKRKKEVQKQLQGFAKMYDAIRNERNKCINLVHAAQQKTTEIKDRVKLLTNEIENLRNTALIRDRMLQRRRLKNANNVAIKDSLKHDYCKIVQVVHEMKEKKEQQLLDLDRLTNMISAIEEEIVALRKKYERAIQQQNESGVLLRTREEEVCILYDKINLQEVMCRNGEIEMHAMDEKIRFLKMKVAEKKRQIELCFKMLPMKSALDADLVVLQIQYSQCKDRIKHLEEIFADPENETRRRILGGKDPSPPELLEKIKKLELELLRKEEKLLETDFVHEQVCRLTERARGRARDGERDALLLAKRTSELQKKIKDKTRKMMALVAELSMKQALAIKLQQEVRDREQFLLTISSRMDQGLPLPQDTEREWLKVLRDERMQKAAAEARAQVGSCRTDFASRCSSACALLCLVPLLGATGP